MTESNPLGTAMGRLEAMIADVDRVQDPKSARHTREIVQALMDFHGGALEKLLELIAATPAGIPLIESLANDDLVSSLLLLYGQHPLDLETRVRQALEKVSPLLRAHGGSVHLIGIEAGVVSLRLEGSCHGCPSSSMTLKNAIEEAIYERAPDVTELVVEGVVEESAVMQLFKDGNGHGHLALPVLSA